MTSPVAAEHIGEEPDDEEPALREQLTEREDKIYVENPHRIDLFGKPLSLIIQSEMSLEVLSHAELGDPSLDYGRLLSTGEIEFEGFYAATPSISVFAQLNLIDERDLDSSNPDGESGFFLERGEMWLHYHEISGGPFSIELGRLDFEDDRLWWWDAELDAVRLTWEQDDFEATVALAHECFPSRSDEGFIDPEHEDVTRILVENSWDWHEDHSVQMFFLHSRDRSGGGNVGDILRETREDEFDGDLAWAGVRFAGAIEAPRRALVGYWLDAGYVRGRETIRESDDFAPGLVEIEDIRTVDVEGWGFDAGTTILFPHPWEPRLTLGWAMGSGDSDPDDGLDRGYRQTSIQGNEPGFGGAERFNAYGVLLEPELSNLSVFSLGLGCTLLESSSLDLVYHNYRLAHAADELRDSRIDTDLTGGGRDVGHGLDLILALEEWESVQFELSASTFRAGRAFGRDEGTWAFGATAALRFAF
ncbi:MAG: alginate export family protein [Verrucomicrobiae bacterium]|nr:alginate export family protein [Verrucomicrobiae bacterium]